MPLQVIDTPLAVIGFNAIFNDLANIDQVEASLYRGEPLISSVLLTTELYQRCASLVLQANNLNPKQIALIIVDVNGQNSLADREMLEQQYLSVQTVSHLNDALFCCEQIINSSDNAVLIISASLAAELTNSEKSTISFDGDFESYASLQGVACILLCGDSFVKANNSICYATINNVTTGEQTEIENIIVNALATASVTDADKVNTIEVTASANKQLNSLEQQALINSYNRVYEAAGGEQKLTTAISCHKSVLGDNGTLSELMGLIHSVISLQQRYRPAIKDWLAPEPELLAQWLDSPFYLFNQATPVFPSVSNKAQLNAFSLLTQQTYTHMILTAKEDGLAHQNGFINNGKQTLFIIGADDQQRLLTKLEQLTVTDDLKGLAVRLYQIAKQNPSVYKVVLIADSIEELNREMQLSLHGIKLAFEKQSDWKTPKGSYFTSQPDSTAKSAFLYPGIGATYVGLGRDLFHLFPEIYPSVIALADNIGASLKDELLNPRSVIALNFKQLKQLDLQLRNSLANIAECGVGYACVFTKIFEQVFKLKADFSSGYSMGEVSMFAALGCWKNPGLMSARLANSETFNQQLSGELVAIRKLWKLENTKTEQPIWETYNIKGTVALVEKAIHADERVYITLINTLDSLVIAGFPADCLKVIKRLGVRAMPLNMANAIHSEPAHQEYENMVALYNMPVTDRIHTKMISSSCYLPIPQHQNAIAVSIAKCLCDPVDFPRLINTLTDKGCKLFIEMGAGRSLSSWTDKILSSEPHISVPINAKGTDDQLTYARAVAKLISFGSTINIECFFSGSLIQNVH